MTVPAIRDWFGGMVGVLVDATGLTVPDDLAYEDWEKIGFHLGVLSDVVKWALADWIIAGEQLYGERAAQGVEITGRSKTTILEYARVARKVPRERRRDLPFTHHQILAARPAVEQDE